MMLKANYEMKHKVYSKVFALASCFSPILIIFSSCERPVSKQRTLSPFEEGWSISRTSIVFRLSKSALDRIDKESTVSDQGFRHLAYVAEQEKGYGVVRDGELLDVWDDVLRDSLCFSEDGDSLSYAARKSNKYYIRVNDHQFGPYDEVGQVIFAPNSSAVSFIARKGAEWIVTVNEREAGHYHCAKNIVFSDDGTRYAYEIQNETSSQFVIDGSVSREFDELGDIVFSQGGDAAFLIAKTEKHWKVFSETAKDREILEERESVDSLEEWAEIEYASGSLAVNQHGEYAYVMKSEQGYYAIRGGNIVVGPCDRIKSTLAWSPDGRKFACVCQKDDQEYVWLDGEELEHFDKVLSWSVDFSLDSSRIAYVAKIGNLQHLVCDDSVGPAFEKIGRYESVFSDGSDEVIYLAAKDEQHFLVREDHESRLHGYVIQMRMGPSLLFTQEDGIRFFGITATGGLATISRVDAIPTEETAPKSELCEEYSPICLPTEAGRNLVPPSLCRVPGIGPSERQFCAHSMDATRRFPRTAA